MCVAPNLRHATPSDPFVRPPPRSSRLKLTGALRWKGTLCFWVLTACAQERLVEGLEQADANEVYVILHQNGLSAEKVRSASNTRQVMFDVRVPLGERDHAYQVLAAHRLPRMKRPGLTDVFGRTLIPSPEAEASMLKVGIEGSIANELRRLAGVLDVLVQVAIPESVPLADPSTALPRPSASVMLVYQPTRGGEPPISAEAVQEFVQSALPALRSGLVSVRLIPAPEFGSTVVTGNVDLLGIEVARSSRTRLLQLLWVAVILSGGLAALAAFGAFRAIHYRRQLTRVTAKMAAHP